MMDDLFKTSKVPEMDKPEVKPVRKRVMMTAPQKSKHHSKVFTAGQQKFAMQRLRDEYAMDRLRRIMREGDV